MRPYLAILRDSFDEALASRVLWISIILSTLLLLVIAPAGVTEHMASRFDDESFLNPSAFAQRLVDAGKKETRSPAKRIYDLASNSTKEQLEKAEAGAGKLPEQLRLRRALVAELNGLITKVDLYNQDDWRGIPLRPEARSLLGEGLDKLSAERLARFNRLAIDAAFPADLRAVGAHQMQFYWAIWESRPFPMERKDLHLQLTSTLQIVMGFFLGVLGILAAILVTSPIIPHTFEPGAIDLLFSKPVARTLVLLTKFLGGCAFILVLVAWMVGGLWLILGFRFGLWHHRLLLCIPLYMFLFAIYYAVSALAGVIWRNAIVSVVLTVLFWGVCWLVGTAKTTTETLSINPQRIVKLISAGDTLLAVTEGGTVRRWDASKGDWNDVFEGSQDMGPAFALGLFNGMIGPIYDRTGNRIFAIDNPLQQFGPLSNKTPLLIGKPAGDWRRERGPTVPTGPEALLLDNEGSLLVVTPLAVYRWDGSIDDKSPPAKVLGFDVPFTSGSHFAEASVRLSMTSPLSAALNPANNEIALFDGRRFVILERDAKQKYRVRVETIIEDETQGIVTYAGKTLALALDYGRIAFYDPADLKEKMTVALSRTNTPRYLNASPDGRWLSGVFHDGRLWLYDTTASAERVPSGINIGDVSAAAFVDNDQLLVADQGTRISEVAIEGLTVTNRRQGPLSLVSKAYYYVVKPIYTVCPKPSELDNLVHYALTGQTSVAMGNRRGLDAGRLKVDIWQPLWSNLAFLSVMLALGSIYVARKDF
ncbi:MAG: ABC transporter permease [Planctomycetes bacterium]|nr:ABC transporter permease [Planctomycetota bacterium]